MKIETLKPTKWKQRPRQDKAFNFTVLSKHEHTKLTRGNMRCTTSKSGQKMSLYLTISPRLYFKSTQDTNQEQFAKRPDAFVNTKQNSDRCRMMSNDVNVFWQITRGQELLVHTCWIREFQDFLVMQALQRNAGRSSRRDLPTCWAFSLRWWTANFQCAARSCLKTHPLATVKAWFPSRASSQIMVVHACSKNWQIDLSVS